LEDEAWNGGDRHPGGMHDPCDAPDKAENFSAARTGDVSDVAASASINARNLVIPDALVPRIRHRPH
jgi:hypothetical protein